MSKQTTISDLVNVLDKITGGRIVSDIWQVPGGTNPFVVMKSSNIPGKSVVETPGLVFGDPQKPVKKIAVCMTLTESAIELAGSTGVDVIIAHHPIADAANSGGVPLKFYLSLYDIAVMELHEAFHGLHPGIPFIHGHQTFRTEIAYGGLPGNIMSVGRALPEIKTVGDIIERLNTFMGISQEKQLLEQEKEIRDSYDIEETCLATSPRVLNGSMENKVSTVLHIFPHTGFSPAHMGQALNEHPEIDTVIASISRVRSDHPLVSKARELNLNFIVGNSHAMEIQENGLPLAYAVQALLPGVEVVVFRERVTATRLEQVGTPEIKRYGREMAYKYLVERS